MCCLVRHARLTRTATPRLPGYAPKDGVYAVRLTPADARIVGVEAVYDFTVEKKSSVKPLWFVIFSAMISALMGGSYLTAKKVQKSMKQKKSRHVGW